MRAADSSASVIASIASANSCRACSIHLEALSRLLGKMQAQPISRPPIRQSGLKSLRYGLTTKKKNFVQEDHGEPSKNRNFIASLSPDLVFPNYGMQRSQRAGRNGFGPFSVSPGPNPTEIVQN